MVNCLAHKCRAAHKFTPSQTVENVMNSPRVYDTVLFHNLPDQFERNIITRDPFAAQATIYLLNNWHQRRIGRLTEQFQPGFKVIEIHVGFMTHC